MPGTVYVASMNMGGEQAPLPLGCRRLNVTSAQAKASLNRRDFSPMTPYPGGYRGYWCFENYWQAGKVYEGVDRDKQLRWMKGQTKPRRRYPGGRGKRVLHAEWDDILEHAVAEPAADEVEAKQPAADEVDPQQFNYVDSRKQVYVPLYYDMVKDRPQVEYWRGEVESGVNVAIYDFDGPRLRDGGVTSRRLSVDLLREKINDETRPFGHGYVVAAMIAGIELDEYVG